MRGGKPSLGLADLWELSRLLRGREQAKLTSLIPHPLRAGVAAAIFKGEPSVLMGAALSTFMHMHLWIAEGSGVHRLHV